MADIRTTHVGSLPRSAEMTDRIFRADAGEDVPDLAEVVGRHVDEVVARQAAVGIDVVSDGEMSKISYATYVKERLTGFGGESPRRAPADLDDYPEFKRKLAEAGGTPTYTRPMCVGEITVADMGPARRDIENLKRATERHGGEPFMNAVSPATVAQFLPNEHYASDEKYIEALAEALRLEYEEIVGAGIKLQVDCPDLGLGRHVVHRELDDDGFAAVARRNVEILNHALRNVPAQMCRAHVCWGNYEGPHTRDIGIDRIFDVLMSLKPQALLFESSNPRHGHEWRVFKERVADIPEDKVLIPGVIDSTTNFVEHPRLVADRIDTFTDIFGTDRVMAGTDCGFATFAGWGAVFPDIAWAKLEALCEGAALASGKA